MQNANDVHRRSYKETDSVYIPRSAANHYEVVTRYRFPIYGTAQRIVSKIPNIILFFLIRPKALLFVYKFRAWQDCSLFAVRTWVTDQLQRYTQSWRVCERQVSDPSRGDRRSFQIPQFQLLRIKSVVVDDLL